mmetsp:Transcript_82015/g.128058  ORF Transcript_82015/g.128058 Transcript_82015/m.128058 type:complete len:88 (-) Transcript_82015:78-341(-)
MTIGGKIYLDCNMPGLVGGGTAIGGLGGNVPHITKETGMLKTGTDDAKPIAFAKFVQSRLAAVASAHDANPLDVTNFVHPSRGTVLS